MRKIYVLTGVETAISLLRPNAKYRLIGNRIEWLDSRQCPTWHEINSTLEKLKQFEDSIECIELE